MYMPERQATRDGSKGIGRNSYYGATWVNLGSINGDPTFETSTATQDIVQLKASEGGEDMYFCGQEHQSPVV